MTPMKRFNLTIILGLMVAALAFGQSTPTQQAAQRLDAATLAATNVTSATTSTITVPAGYYFYMTGIDIQNCAGGTAVTAAAPTTITTTNFSGSPAWTVGSGVTAGLCTSQSVQMGAPLKSAAAGTNVTFVMPTFATNQTIRLNVYGYLAQ